MAFIDPTRERPGGDGRVLAWDLPTRLFHWTLALLVLLAWVSKKFGDPTLVWHTFNGYAILTLILWRVLWGFAGGTTARFASFLAGPVAMVRFAADFLRGTGRPYLGHNPIFGLVVLAFLGLLAAQGLTGLFASDDIVAEGPLAARASGAWVAFLTKWHHRIFDLILILIGLHLAANLMHLLWKRENLNPPMLHGLKPAGAYADAAAARPGSNLRALGLLVVSGAVVLGAVYGFGGRL